MTTPMKTMELTITRTISATPDEVFDAWLDPSVPCNPWNGSDRLIFEPKVNTAFNVTYGKGAKENPHFGRFIALERGTRIQHTWMSRYTHGLESIVTITLRKQGDDTLLTLHHTGLPDDDDGRGHEGGWGHFLDRIVDHYTRQGAAVSKG